MNNNTTKSDSILKKRIRRFKSIKRGYYSLIILVSLYIISIIAPILISKEALMICYANGNYDNGEKFEDTNNNGIYDSSELFTDNYNYYFPAFNKMFEGIIGPTYYEASFFGQDSIQGKKKYGAPHYRLLKKKFKKENLGNYIVMPIYPFGPFEEVLSERDEPFNDRNKNGKWDNAEKFEDTNNNAVWDDAEKFEDTNSNSVWDDAEKFIDHNGNNKWDLAEIFMDNNNNGLWDKAELYTDTNNNGKWDKAEPFEDANSNKTWDNHEMFIDENNNKEYDEYYPATFPDSINILGTDNQGRDVFARLIYGLKVSLTFALVVTFFSYTLGTIVGGTLGYFGGKVDLFGLRLIEIFSALPFLFLMMILGQIFKPSIMLLAFMYMFIAGWIGISWYVRGEFYREKSKDYVSAAVSMGQSTWKIIIKHILPNALTPIITYAPFAVIGYISALVSLDFLGFGLQPPTPSWGELLVQGKANLQYWHLIVVPLSAIGVTLFLITFIGEAIREAFDPKVYSRLR